MTDPVTTSALTAVAGASALAANANANAPVPDASVSGAQSSATDGETDTPDKGDQGVTVTLSAEGRTLARMSGGISGAAPAQRSDNSDIDDSDLPLGIKNALKQIRELKQQLKEKMEELQRTMSDQTLAPKQRAAKVQQLQAEIGVITTALATAMKALSEALQSSGVSPEQLQTAAKLAMV
ncbi:hypothetical protein [Schauerella aestuarii]|uniref:hypothetical protein n=1 Tax=Schauerella aestuarii TaxID=2511204 RepID=UPI001371F161|nr:hypothetical protein [Achromobacter aestuarii]MYZ44608.1 hypothetical protein [Achromobacter aestuarii]